MTTTTSAPIEAPAWFDPTLDLQPSTTAMIVGGQQPTVLPVVRIAGYQYHAKIGAPLEQFVLVDLSGTVVSPGKVLFDRDDKRGYFTDRVEVRLWFEDEPRLTVRQAGPATSDEGGSASTSMSFSVSGGFFGETPTANVGWSISSGVSQQLPDFEIQKDVGSEGRAALRHAYVLRLIEGNVYYDPIDAVDATSSGHIRRLPPKAGHDLDVFSSALFHTPTAIGATRRLRLQITHRVVCLEKTYQLPAMGTKGQPYDRSRSDSSQSCLVSCSLGWLKVDVGAVSVTHDWAFAVDLDHGDATVSTV